MTGRSVIDRHQSRRDVLAAEQFIVPPAKYAAISAKYSGVRRFITDLARTRELFPEPDASGHMTNCSRGIFDVDVLEIVLSRLKNDDRFPHALRRRSGMPIDLRKLLRDTPPVNELILYQYLRERSLAAIFPPCIP